LRKWSEIIEEMVLFRPELVIISAGFDAHDADPLSDTELTVSDFEWATRAVLEACVRICPERPPPCISSLEGGYDLNALAECALAHAICLASFQIPAPIVESNAAPQDDNIAAGNEPQEAVAAEVGAVEGIGGERDGVEDDAKVDDDGDEDGDEIAALEKFVEFLNL